MQRTPGSLDALQERNHEVTGAGYPHMLKDELMWKKVGLAEQRAVARSQE